MEIVTQIWAAVVALFQALAVISLYLVVMHVVTTASEYFGNVRFDFGRGSALCLPVQGDHKGAPLRNNRPNVTLPKYSDRRKAAYHTEVSDADADDDV